jgi:hypothetical protein
MWDVLPSSSPKTPGRHIGAIPRDFTVPANGVDQGVKHRENEGNRLHRIDAVDVGSVVVVAWALDFVLNRVRRGLRLGQDRATDPYCDGLVDVRTGRPEGQWSLCDGIVHSTEVASPSSVRPLAAL